MLSTLEAAGEQREGEVVMDSLTMLQCKQILEDVMSGLFAYNETEKSGYYSGLFPEGVSEYEIAKVVPKFPELHPLMGQLVQRIIDLPDYPIWIDEEEQAGCLLSCALALYNKKYCKQFAECIAKQDLDHEVNQNDYIRSVFEKWGACKQTAMLVKARIDNPGQYGPDIVEELISEYVDLSDYLDKSDSSENIVTPRVSIGQIEQAKSTKKLMNYYIDAITDFTNELCALYVDLILAYSKNNNAPISVLTIRLDTDNNALVFSITDDKEVCQNAYHTAKTNCLAPLAKVCEKLDYKLRSKVAEFSNKYFMSSLSAFDLGTFTKTFKVKICL